MRSQHDNRSLLGVPLPHDRTSWLRAGLATIPLFLFFAVGVVHIAGGGPFGHDEAVYATRARDFALGREPGSYWIAYRSPGLSLVLTPLWLARESVALSRLVVLLFACAGIALTITLAWRLFDGRVAVVAGTLLALTPGYLHASILNWPDVPGAVFGLAAIVVLVFATWGRRVSPWVLAVVPLAALATYTRYGAPIPVAIGLSIFALHAWPAVMRSIPLVSAVAVSTLAAIAAILFVPALTGSEEAPQHAIRARYLSSSEPWWTPAEHFSGQLDDLLGRPLLVLLIVGIMLAILAGARRLTAPVPLLAVSATLVLTVLGLVYTLAHGEPRYLAPALPFLMILAAVGLTTIRQVVGTRTGAALLLLSVLVLAPRVHSEGRETMDLLKDRWTTLRLVSAQIDERLSEDCAVVTSYSPQVEWYSGCRTTLLPAADEGPPYEQRLARTVERLDQEDVVMLLLEGGKRQPDGADREAAIASAQELVFSEGEPGEYLGFAEIFRMR